MKTVYLIRHAESGWDSPTNKDFDRSLSDNGISDIPLIAKELDGIDFNPDLILCSTALRTTTTAEILMKELSLKTNILFDSSIYNASLDYLKELITYIPKKCDTVALIGHNPGVSILANYLTDDFSENMSPCGVVKIELEIDNWNEVIQGIGSIKHYVYPKMLYSEKN